MKKFAVGVSWTMTSRITVEANSPEDAVEKLREADQNGKIPIPKTNAYYLDDSFSIDEESVDPVEHIVSRALSEISVDQTGTVTTE